MRKAGYIVLAVVAAGISASPAYAADEATPAQGQAAVATTNVVKHQTMCPVQGEKINKKLFVDSEGKRIYVCCPMCLPAVKKDPAKYIKQIEDQGITLDKAEPAKSKAPNTDAAPNAGGGGMEHPM